MKRLMMAALAVVTSATTGLADDQSVFGALSARCGQAFSGKVVRDTEASDLWGEAVIVLHIRSCGKSEIKAPLHVGDNRSRVWILTRLYGDHLRLKHDHRHADGSADAVTMYGGKSDSPDSTLVSFPVDQESIAMFEKNGLAASVSNTWHISLDGDAFRYRLTRPSGRDFIVEFDLSQPMDVPPDAWDLAAGYGHR